jgi:hypothetical protein
MQARSHFTRLRPAATLALGLGLCCAACGGSSSTTSGGVTNGGPNAGGGSQLNFTGTVAITLTGKATCKTDGGAFQGDVSQTIGDKVYLFQFIAPHYSGAGTYAIDPTDSIPEAVLNNEVGTTWDSQHSANPGSIVVNAGAQSGTISGTLVDHDTNQTVSVSGTWSCGG